MPAMERSGWTQVGALWMAAVLLTALALAAWGDDDDDGGGGGTAMTMVIATHEMGFARQIADRVCLLEGVILEQGPPEQIFGSPREERTQAFLKRIIEAGRAADLTATGPS